MDVEKLIDRLWQHNKDWGDGRTQNFFQVCLDCKSAAEALTTLQAELSKVKAERDAYKIYFDDLSSKPDCNTCDDKDCRYRPRVGAIVRVNCPFWCEKEE